MPTVGEDMESLELLYIAGGSINFDPFISYLAILLKQYKTTEIHMCICIDIYGIKDQRQRNSLYLFIIPIN